MISVQSTGAVALMTRPVQFSSDCPLSAKRIKLIRTTYEHWMAQVDSTSSLEKMKLDYVGWSQHLADQNSRVLLLLVERWRRGGRVRTSLSGMKVGQSWAETRERSAACYGLDFQSSAWRTTITMRVAGLVDRGPAAKSTRAGLLGDRVRRQRVEWAVVYRDALMAATTADREFVRMTTRTLVHYA